MIALDATVLMLLVDPRAPIPPDAAGRALTYPAERVQAMVERLSSEGIRVLIPTPALAEVLVRLEPDRAVDVVNLLRARSSVLYGDFDARAALEVASMGRLPRAKGGRKLAPRDEQVYAKLKYDRQIVAIAKVHGADTLYSEDSGLSAFAEQQGLVVQRVADLPIPPDRLQGALEL